MPPTTTIASGFWACEPIEVASAAGNSPSAAVSDVITTGRTRSSAPRMQRLLEPASPRPASG